MFGKTSDLFGDRAQNRTLRPKNRTTFWVQKNQETFQGQKKSGEIGKPPFFCLLEILRTFLFLFFHLVFFSVAQNFGQFSLFFRDFLAFFDDFRRCLHYFGVFFLANSPKKPQKSSKNNLKSTSNDLKMTRIDLNTTRIDLKSTRIYLKSTKIYLKSNRSYLKSTNNLKRHSLKRENDFT